MHCCHPLPWPCSHVHALQEIEAAYNDKPYHNSMHAADVTQSVGALLATDGFSDQLTDLELLAVILASIVHDVGHPGERWSLGLEVWPHRCSSCLVQLPTVTSALATSIAVTCAHADCMLASAEFSLCKWCSGPGLP